MYGVYQLDRRTHAGKLQESSEGLILIRIPSEELNYVLVARIVSCMVEIEIHTTRSMRSLLFRIEVGNQIETCFVKADLTDSTNLLWLQEIISEIRFAQASALKSFPRKSFVNKDLFREIAVLNILFRSVFTVILSLFTSTPYNLSGEIYLFPK